MSTPRPALNLVVGQTTHRRRTPFEQQFAYNLFMLELDIDRLDEASTASPVFSANGPNLFAFRTKDHGPRDGSPLRPWAEAHFRAAGVALHGGAIRLITFPRHLFYKFAPISVWLGHDAEGNLAGVIYEVNNTFGDSHCYVAPVASERSQHEAEKFLYVSPFFDVEGKYAFTLTSTERRFDLVVSTRIDGSETHMANIKALRQPATTAAFLGATARRPFSTLGVTVGIHWEALKLWLKGAGYRSRPAAPVRPHTLAHASDPVPTLSRGDAA